MTNKLPASLQGYLFMMALCAILFGLGYATNDPETVIRALWLGLAVSLAFGGLEAFARSAKKHGVRYEVTRKYPCGSVRRATGYRYLGLSSETPDTQAARHKGGCPNHGDKCIVTSLSGPQPQLYAAR